jgi:nucleoside-diphosphate-sugar epimerase
MERCMRFVVTGITGFVGSHFVEHALSAGHQVTGICNSTGNEKKALRAQLQSQGALLRSGNILAADSLVSAMSGGEVVCHFAAAFRESGVDDEYFQRLNVQGTANVLEAAAKAGVRRFVLCSTAGIYGQRVSGVVDETTTAAPFNGYERSKLACEELLRKLATQLGIEYVIVRPASVYGPRDQRLLKLFKSAAKGRFPLFGAGKGRRHMIYVTDLADAFLRAATTPAAASRDFIIAGPRSVPLHEMLDELACVVKRRSCGPKLPLKPMLALAAVVEDVSRLVKVSPPIYRRRMDFYLNDVAFNTNRARSVLNWQPQVDLREGLAYTFESYQSQGSIAAARPAMHAAMTVNAIMIAAEVADQALQVVSTVS